MMDNVRSLVRHLLKKNKPGMCRCRIAFPVHRHSVTEQKLFPAGISTQSVASEPPRIYEPCSVTFLILSSYTTLLWPSHLSKHHKNRTPPLQWDLLFQDWLWKPISCFINFYIRHPSLACFPVWTIHCALFWRKIKSFRPYLPHSGCNPREPL